MTTDSKKDTGAAMGVDLGPEEHDVTVELPPKPEPLKPGELPLAIRQALVSEAGKNRHERRRLRSIKRKARRLLERKKARATMGRESS